MFFFFFQAEDGIRDLTVTGVQTCALPIWLPSARPSCHDKISLAWRNPGSWCEARRPGSSRCSYGRESECPANRSEEHTSELQSQSNLVCRLLLEKKKHSNARILAGSSGPI